MDKKRNRAEHGIEKLLEHICSLTAGSYFIRKWRQPLMSKKRSELRMNRREKLKRTIRLLVLLDAHGMMILSKHVLHTF